MHCVACLTSSAIMNRELHFRNTMRNSFFNYSKLAVLLGIVASTVLVACDQQKEQQTAPAESTTATQAASSDTSATPQFLEIKTEFFNFKVCPNADLLPALKEKGIVKVDDNQYCFAMSTKFDQLPYIETGTGANIVMNWFAEYYARQVFFNQLKLMGKPVDPKLNYSETLKTIIEYADKLYSNPEMVTIADPTASGKKATKVSALKALHTSFNFEVKLISNFHDVASIKADATATNYYTGENEQVTPNFLTYNKKTAEIYAVSPQKSTIAKEPEKFFSILRANIPNAQVIFDNYYTATFFEDGLEMYGVDPKTYNVKSVRIPYNLMVDLLKPEVFTALTGRDPEEVKAELEAQKHATEPASTAPATPATESAAPTTKEKK